MEKHFIGTPVNIQLAITATNILLFDLTTAIYLPLVLDIRAQISRDGHNFNLDEYLLPQMNDRAKDFRFHLLDNLIPRPFSDPKKCQDIRQSLLAATKALSQHRHETAHHQSADDFARQKQRLDEQQTAIENRRSGSTLSESEMKEYLALVLIPLIRKMLDDDIAGGHLVVTGPPDKRFVLLDDLAAWAAYRKITIEQDALPGCPPLIQGSYQRLHQRISVEQQRATSFAAPEMSETQAATVTAKVAPGVVADWKESARKIADECFDNDTNGNPPTRDSLIRFDKRGQAVGGYAVRVMEIMQQRGIHGPRGMFVNANTISREALQGAKWWAGKSK